MNANENIRRYAAVFGFAILLLVPSFDSIYKYLGLTGIAIYFIVGTVILLLGYRFAVPFLKASLSERAANILAGLTFLCLIAVVAIGYPLANSGRFGGGSDADEALIMAAKAIASGIYPYTQVTYLGNLISPMPGAVFFGMPFSLTGLFQFQNVFWFGVLFFLIRHLSGRGSIGLGLSWLLLVLCPTVIWNFVTGSDYATNTIYIAILMWILVRKCAETEAPEWQRIIPAILLGIGLSSRSNFILMMPLLLSALVQNAGWRPAIKYLAISGVIFMLVTVPFWLHDPVGFAPLAAQGSKLKDLVDVLPYANIIIPGTAGILTLVLALRKLPVDCAALFRNCAVVQLFILLFTCTVSSIKAGHPDIFLRQSGYGMFTLIFAAISAWIFCFRIGYETKANRNLEF